MLRRGALGLAVVVGDVRPANDVAEEHGDEGGVGGGHGPQRGPALAPGHPLRPGIKSTARGGSLNANADLIASDGHTSDSLAATLGCARSMAAELLAGRRRWTDHQRAKLTRRAG